MEKTEVVAKIIEYVGGKDNVVNTWHCMTRLRFELKDTSKIQEDAIKALDGVIGVQFAKGSCRSYWAPVSTSITTSPCSSWT